MAEDTSLALAAISAENRRMLAALSEASGVELTGAIGSAHRAGGGNLVALIALMRRARQSKLGTARRAVREEAGGGRARLLRAPDSRVSREGPLL